LPDDPPAVVGIERPDNSGLLADRQQPLAAVEHDQIGGRAEIVVGPVRFGAVGFVDGKARAIAHVARQELA
jgi:hypothetical protein